MSLIFPINDIYKDEKNNIKNENLILKDILTSRN